MAGLRKNNDSIAASQSRFPTIRPVSQIMMTVRSRDQKRNALELCRTAVLEFIQSRAGTKLPAEAWDGRSFELEDIGAQRAAAVAIDMTETSRYWAARLDDADKQVAQRSWTVEAGIAEISPIRAVVGCRLMCVTRGTPIPYERTIPRFVRSLIDTQDVEVDGRATSARPWVVHTEDDVQELVDLLISKQRRNDVIVFALPEGSNDERQTIANADAVAQRTAGAAHVVVITDPASYVLTNMVGREFSVFRQAVRTYKPLFDFENDEPFQHPLALPKRVLGWPGGGVKAYEGLLVSQALIRTVFRPDLEDLHPSFSTVRRLAGAQRIAEEKDSGAGDADLLAIAEEEIAALRKSIDEEKATNAGLLQSADEERDLAFADAAQATATNAHLRQRVRELEERLKHVEAAPPTTPIPESVRDLEEWCGRHLAGSVEVLNRAFQGAKKSVYDDAELLYKALLLLRDFYVPMKRTGGSEALARYQHACNDLGIAEEATFHGERAGEQGDTYFVHFSGRRTELDRHLKKGTSRDPRFCFRLYFFWDEETEQAVVGWFPSHLETRAS